MRTQSDGIYGLSSKAALNIQNKESGLMVALKIQEMIPAVKI